MRSSGNLDDKRLRWCNFSDIGLSRRKRNQLRKRLPELDELNSATEKLNYRGIDRKNNNKRTEFSGAEGEKIL